MAERRMFAKAVVNSCRFLRMPVGARLLYYDLGMAADDDGVAEAFVVLRTTEASKDDLTELVSSGFLVFLDEEELVVYISDWTRNNQIRSDRYHESQYGYLLDARGLPRGVKRDTENSQVDNSQVDCTGDCNKHQFYKGKNMVVSERGSGETLEHQNLQPLTPEEFEKSRDKAIEAVSNYGR